MPQTVGFGYTSLVIAYHLSLQQNVLHQEVGHKQVAGAVPVVVDISPAAAVDNALVGGIVVHVQEHPCQFFFHSLVGGVVPRRCYAAHQLEVCGHFDVCLGEHIFVPVRDDTFVSLGLTHEPYRPTGDPVSIARYVVVSESGAYG